MRSVHPSQEVALVTRLCTICTHPDRHTIDREIVAGTPYRRIASQFSVTEISVRRHRDNHLSETLRQGHEEGQEVHRLDVAQQLRDINEATMRVLVDARQSGEADLVLRAVDRVLKQLELQAKLLGDLDTQPQVNIILSPKWIVLRGVIVEALIPWPDARIAVADAIAGAGA
jgi:hypothetical protein